MTISRIYQYGAIRLHRWGYLTTPGTKYQYCQIPYHKRSDSSVVSSYRLTLHSRSLRPFSSILISLIHETMNYIDKYYKWLKDWYAAHKDTPTETELQQGPYKSTVTKLTDEQKEQLQSEYHEMRIRMEEKAARERSWKERRYEDSTEATERLW